ncbi:MAG: NAD(+) synthase [Candidatus Dadabacteria bacterium]|nr:MAG: NAD(+) synthase [Candidatus Dadabacteria bacterium]
MIKDVQAVAKFLEITVRDFTDVAVVGVSGGVDSSLVACICTAALGPKNVYLVSMPYDKIDTDTFNSRSAELAEVLKANHFVVPIKEACTPIEEELKKVFADKPLDKLTLANIRPRVRMNILYSISAELGYKLKKRVRVMGTGHLSEDIIGYDTKGGDALADIFILSDLVKSEVYQLAEYYPVPESILKAEPSAGLYPGQTDFNELGYTYDQLEAPSLALFKALKRGVPRSKLSPALPEFHGLNPEISSFVIERYKQHYHKHQAPVTVDLRKPAWFTDAVPESER